MRPRRLSDMPRNDPSIATSDPRHSDRPGSCAFSVAESLDGGDIPLVSQQAAKKRKLDQAIMSPSRGRDVVFKLTCDCLKATRVVMVNKSSPGKELFDKARQFYQLFYPNTEVNILACQVPSKNEYRYLYNGEDGEAAYFMREMKDITSITGGTALIEVKYVKS